MQYRVNYLYKLDIMAAESNMNTNNKFKKNSSLSVNKKDNIERPFIDYLTDAMKLK